MCVVSLLFALAPPSAVPSAGYRGRHCGCTHEKLLADHPEFMKKVVDYFEETQAKRKTVFQRPKAKACPSLAQSTGSVSHPVCLDGATPLGYPSDTPSDTTSGALVYDIRWSALSASSKREKERECHDAWALFFFGNNIPFNAIVAGGYFKGAIQKTKECPSYTPQDRQTLSGAQLERMNEKANAYKEIRLKTSVDMGYVITGDGYKSSTKRKYNNHILVGVSGPIYLGLVDVTGDGGTGDDVFTEFDDVLASLDEDVREATLIGILDTPSCNRKAWRLLMEKHPRMIWCGCMAHEISLLMKDVMAIAMSRQLYARCLALYKWVMHHNALLGIFKAKVREVFDVEHKAAKNHSDKSAATARKTMSLYKPGDTRMLTGFRLLYRTMFLMKALVAMFSDAKYDSIAQSIMSDHNKSSKKKDKDGIGRWGGPARDLLPNTSVPFS